jgi:hypothetical protein
MSDNRHIWDSWADFLHRWGLEHITTALLEAAGPLKMLGAQLIHFSSPFLTSISKQAHLETLADLLEDQTASKAFIEYVRYRGVENPELESS